MADHTDQWVLAFSDLQTLVITTGDIEVFFQRLVDIAATFTQPALSCGVTLHYATSPFTAVFSDIKAIELDEIQYATGDGPCLEAHRTSTVIDLDDIEHEQRWPEYVVAARRLGLRSALSLPLITNGRSVGALNLYSLAERGAFPADLRRQCEIFTQLATSTLQLLLGRAADEQVRHQLEHALTSRAVIDQALGILMGQQRCTSTEAFVLLRRRSQLTNTKIRDVAAQLITHLTGQPPQPVADFDTAAHRTSRVAGPH